MKKLIAILLTLVLLCGSAMPAFAFPITEDGYNKDDTYGIAAGYVRVKQCFKSDDSVSTVTRAYDKNGNLLKETETFKTSDGYSVISKIRRTYDEKGNLTKEAEYYSDHSTISAYTYDDSGKVTKEILKNTEGDSTQITKISYYYNNAGKMTKEIHLATEDNSKTTTTYSYNKAGELVKEITRDDSGVRVLTYTYNKLGKLTKETYKCTDEDNSIYTTTTTYSYDKNGNETEMKKVEKNPDGNKEISKNTCVYNEKGLCIKSTESTFRQSSDGETVSFRFVTTYTYDKNGNITKKVYKSIYDGDDSIYNTTETTLYTYDTAGNMIKKVLTTTGVDGPCYVETVTNTYKAGLLVRRTTVFEQHGDAPDKWVETLTYDKAGNLTKYVYSCRFSNGESMKEVITYAYQKIGA